MKYGFIGCGNMGGAIATALSKTTKDIMLADFDAQKAENLAKELNCSFGTNDDVVLNWDKVSGASGYAIYYKKQTSDEFVLLKRVIRSYLRRWDLLWRYHRSRWGARRG
jgi:hypothetical protein